MKPLMRSLSISSMLTLTALLWGCSDVISEQYPTEAEGVFERGWLPPILPPSATEIWTTTAPAAVSVCPPRQ
ncbi:hypothetical protein [Shewanella algae]|uniref:hypothetical protein n=1 Tax=Shewanella algae TaxID=38313 RepID=UPI003C5E5E91